MQTMQQRSKYDLTLNSIYKVGFCGINGKIDVCLMYVVSTILLEPSCEATITNTGDISIQVLVVSSNN